MGGKTERSAARSLRAVARTGAALALLSILSCKDEDASPDAPHLYLASITGLELEEGEGIDSFQLDTWGVAFRAVCHVPRDWEITAGEFGMSGKLAGQAGHGTSWIRSGGSSALSELALVEMWGPPQATQVGDIPPSFAGTVTLLSSREDQVREIPLDLSRVKLTPATQCPPVKIPKES